MKDRCKIYHLDLIGCKSGWDIHKRIKKNLDFPDYYGMNWDAFWDVIRGFDTSLIKIKGTDTIAPELKKYVTKMLEIMEEAKQESHMLDYVVIDHDGNLTNKA